MKAKQYTGYLGGFDYWHKNPPAPFNPLADPKGSEKFKRVTDSMVRDNFYQTHTRAECKAEWARRAEIVWAGGNV